MSDALTREWQATVLMSMLRQEKNPAEAVRKHMTSLMYRLECAGMAEREATKKAQRYGRTDAEIQREEAWQESEKERLALDPDRT